MAPFLRHGDVVELERVPAVDIRPGDVVLAALDGNRYVLHRVIRIAGSRVLLRSDAGAEDGWIPVSGIIGRARSVQRRQTWQSLTTPRARRAALLWHRLRFIAAPLLKTLLRLRRALRRRSPFSSVPEEPA